MLLGQICCRTERGSDRILGSTPSIISNLDIHGVGEKVSVGSGRYHHPTRAARAGDPGPLAVPHRTRNTIRQLHCDCEIHQLQSRSLT
jgi:hypothetical protein